MTGELRSLRVHATGPQALVEDLGRPGRAGIGVGRSGAADRGALRAGNRALGNPEGHAAIEVLGGGLEVEVLGEPGETVWFCVSGAPCEVALDGPSGRRGVGSHAVVPAGAGQRITLGPSAVGLRSYLAVRGGVAVEEVLGSRSSDVLSGLGPTPLAEGDELPLGRPAGDFPSADTVAVPRLGEDAVLRAVRGPRDDWLTDADALVTTTWQVSDRSNRVGMRLGGGTLAHSRDEELPSEGVWRGAVQVPPSGEPVLFLADHPVTGGYPVVAVVVEADVDRAAQLRPGQPVRFRWVQP